MSNSSLSSCRMEDYLSSIKNQSPVSTGITVGGYAAAATVAASLPGTAEAEVITSAISNQVVLEFDDIQDPGGPVSQFGVDVQATPIDVNGDGINDLIFVASNFLLVNSGNGDRQMQVSGGVVGLNGGAVAATSLSYRNAAIFNSSQRIDAVTGADPANLPAGPSVGAQYGNWGFFQTTASAADIITRVNSQPGVGPVTNQSAYKLRGGNNVGVRNSRPNFWSPILNGGAGLSRGSSSNGQNVYINNRFLGGYLNTASNERLYYFLEVSAVFYRQPDGGEAGITNDLWRLTINGAAYESTPDTSIHVTSIANVIPEPSGIALLALGASSLASFRRRRKTEHQRYLDDHKKNNAISD